jgi:predicted GNAT family acetyltransferase
VIEATQATLAPTVSLYVNDFNAPAIAAYDAVGFERVGMFATVMF